MTNSDTSSRVSASAQATVVALFRTRDAAENARNRLRTEGVAEERIVFKVLREQTSSVPSTTEAELETLSVDPFFAILGDLKQDYVGQIRNGETLIVVHRVSRDTAADVARVLQYFRPLRVDIVPQSATSKYAGAGPMP